MTCLYGRVEVMGFTIEEGQKSYPLYSPASHCPLTVRALETSHFHRNDRAEASQILQKYLPPGMELEESVKDQTTKCVKSDLVCSITEEATKEDNAGVLGHPG